MLIRDEIILTATAPEVTKAERTCTMTLSDRLDQITKQMCPLRVKSEYTYERIEELREYISNFPDSSLVPVFENEIKRLESLPG